MASALARLGDPAGSATWSAEEWKLARGLCAGYVRLLDEGLGRLLDGLEATEAGRKCLVIVAAGRGLTLSPQAGVPDRLASLRSELTETPLFVRLPGQNEGVRRQELVQSADIVPTLAEWFGVSVVSAGEECSLLRLARDEGEVRERAETIGNSGVAAIRTIDARLIGRLRRRSRGGGHELDDVRLFRKPEDLWETLDVATSMPERTEALSAELIGSLTGSIDMK